MNSPSKNEALKEASSRLLDGALKEIRAGRQSHPTSMKKHFLTAEYLLLEAKEYIDGAWDMLVSNRCDASIALSRWVLEASMNLFWVVGDKEETEQRLRNLVGDALRCEANLLDGLAKLWPDKAPTFENKAHEARERRQALGAAQLRSLSARVNSIGEPDKLDWPKLYVLYRICCAVAHPGLNVWERFSDVDNATISISPIDRRRTACWMAAASTLYLVASAYCLTELGEAKNLTDWWQNQVGPLLGGY